MLRHLTILLDQRLGDDDLLYAVLTDVYKRQMVVLAECRIVGKE